MRLSQDVMAYEALGEALPLLDYKPTTAFQRGKHVEYIDTTCTFDIETTNGDADGFAYSFQTCIGGLVIVPRYFEDWAELIETLCDKWRVTEKRKLIIYVHNLGYEFTYLIQLLTLRWGDCKALYTKSRKPLTLEFSNGIEFRDSLKLFQKSLARATEGCKHEKLKGDLDYTVYRTPDTPLDDKEFAYCVNDVLGLYEAIERMKKEHGFNAATLPLSNTALVKQEVNKTVNKDKGFDPIRKALTLTKSQTYLAYKAMAGGDTHGARWKAGYTFTNCNSYDFKSAHPSQQLLWKFPSGQPIDLPENTPEEDMNGIIDNGMGWVGQVAVSGLHIKDECPDPCISVSKCINTEVITDSDNGRVLDTAGTLILFCDSNDWQRIRDGYEYEEMTALDSFAFRLSYLPDSFRMAIFEKFKIKETMKGSPEYMFSKICVNTIYGATAQKQIRDEYTADIGETIDFEKLGWEKNLEDMDDKDVEKAQNKKNTFPFLWGLWTASLTRLKLWRLLKIVGWDKVIYWDTDSCKFEGAKVPAVEEYNREIQEQCKKRGVVVDKADGEKVYIGVAEDEHPTADFGYKEFRFLHAKCYAARTYEGKLESTIAGVGKKEGVTALKDDIENLTDMLVIEDAGGLMLTYHDAPAHVRTDFAKPTMSASWVVMTPRRYEVKGVTPEDIDIERLG
jgi:hypothetical protein